MVENVIVLMLVATAGAYTVVRLRRLAAGESKCACGTKSCGSASPSCGTCSAAPSSEAGGLHVLNSPRGQGGCGKT
jgi:hypothetical protein